MCDWIAQRHQNRRDVFTKKVESAEQVIQTVLDTLDCIRNRWRSFADEV